MENFLPHGLLARDENLLETRLRQFREDGPEKLHLLFDYDGTITHEWDENGNPRPSLIATLREENYLNEQYSAEAKALAEHYKTIERDPAVDIVTKRSLMQEWWEKHYALLIRHHLNRSDIHKAMQDSRVRIRSGMRQIIERAQKAGVPVVIMSANGLGTESIQWHLEHNGLMSPNIIIVSNDLQWDDQGFMNGYRQPIIHSLNKDETVLSSLPAYATVRGRTNIIQMGDSLHDVGMAAGIAGAKVLSVGFYNYRDDERLPKYLETFDALVKDDGEGLELVDMLERVL